MWRNVGSLTQMIYTLSSIPGANVSNSPFRNHTYAIRIKSVNMIFLDDKEMIYFLFLLKPKIMGTR